jgi:hypothetical protein
MEESKETKETKQKKKETKAPTWEVKDRNYYLLHGRSPLTYTLPAKHTRRFPLLWFDPETGMQRELRYATNQSSPFVDEQTGQVTLKHIIFKDGVLHVPKEQQNLQKLLSLYHPHLNKRYAELDHVAEAKDELEDLMIETEAITIALGMDIDHAEAVLRVEEGSSVSNLSSKEIKRDIALFAKRNPKLFIDLANDENVVLRNFAIKAKEAGIISLGQDQRTIHWASNGKKLMTVPFDENPFSAMAAWFQTDEGLEVYKSIEKKFS